MYEKAKSIFTLLSNKKNKIIIKNLPSDPRIMTGMASDSVLIFPILLVSCCKNVALQNPNPLTFRKTTYFYRKKSTYFDGATLSSTIVEPSSPSMPK